MNLLRLRPFRTPARILPILLLLALCLGSASDASAKKSPASSSAKPAKPSSLERRFTELPLAECRLIAPFLWLHGDESKECLDTFIEKLAEGHNGSFIAESRPHSDWLGPQWYADVKVCLDQAKKLGMTMWIYDERWWPSQTLGGKVPARYAAKELEATSVSLQGPRLYNAQGLGGEHFVAAIAGRAAKDGIDPASLVDLAPKIKNGSLAWNAPAGNWRVMTFTWRTSKRVNAGGCLSVDGASKECVDWFIKTVYQPHYDHFKADFGKTIVGTFYDEPETDGDWGTELPKIFAERKVDPKKALVAYKFHLGGDEQAAARYAYLDAFHEAWGRTLYGGMLRWCEERKVVNIGHFIDEYGQYLTTDRGPGNIFQMQKYSSMGGMDLICDQLDPGQRTEGIYQLPKLVSSISHAYNKKDHLAFSEIYGGYGQKLTYPMMKWLADQHEVRGVNMMVPHSFNPRAPYDSDYPPFFYEGAVEPRWPLYRVWADYTSRLSLMLTGGRHVCPVAILFCGNSIYAGKAITPEEMTTPLQDALYDCDWIPYEVFEKAELAQRTIKLHEERYKVLVVPPVEVIPYATLAKARQFFDKGGVVVGYGFLPTKSATLGRSSSEIARLREAIWGQPQQPGAGLCKKSASGGRSYFLPEKPTAEQIQQVLAVESGVRPTLEVLEGRTDRWLHVLHRVKEGRDVFFVCNQNLDGGARRFKLRATAPGWPECWDPMRNERTALPCKRTASGVVEFELTLEPLESVLLVFSEKPSARPARLVAGAKPMGTPIEVKRRPNPPAPVVAKARPALEGCMWVWFPEPKADPLKNAPAGMRFFRHAVQIPEGRKIKRATFHLSADNLYVLYLGGKEVSRNESGSDAWHTPRPIDMTGQVKPGRNQWGIAVYNYPEQPVSHAGLVGRLVVEFDQGAPLSFPIDKSWKCWDQDAEGWTGAGFNDTAWPSAKELVRFGEKPWDDLTLEPKSPAAPADPFQGEFTLAAGIDPELVRAYLELEGLPNEGASIKVNGAYAGGIIGAPIRLDVTGLLHPGPNTVRIEPYAPKSARLVLYPIPAR